MARPKKSNEPPRRDRTGALYVLLEPSMLAELDTWIARLNKDPDAPQWTRAGVVKALLRKGLRERGERGEAP